MAPGCNPHQNRPKVKYPGGYALRYIQLGGGTRASDSQLLEQVCYRGGGNDGRSYQLRDYNKRIDGFVEDELTKLTEV